MASKPFSSRKRPTIKVTKKSDVGSEEAPRSTISVNKEVLQGKGGRTERPSTADKEFVDQEVLNLTLALGARDNLESQARIIQVEFFSEVGVTSYLAPIIRSGAVLGIATKALVSAHLDGVVKIADRLLFGHPMHPRGPAILTGARALVFAAGGTTVEHVRAALVSELHPIASAMPACRVREVKGGDFTEAANWLLRSMSASRLISNDKGNTVLKTLEEQLTPLMRSRLLEIRSQRDPAMCIAGVGQGVGLVRGLRAKLGSWQKGRPDTGTVVGPEFDPWCYWFSVRQGEPGNLLAPVRWDALPKAGIPVARRSRQKRSALPPKAAQKKIAGKRFASRKTKPEEPTDEG